MDLQAISTFISSVGFPVAAFGAMLYMYYKQGEKNSEFQSKWLESLNNNTKALEVLQEVVRSAHADRK